jgi:rhodanese-related sulfurtransferase
MIVEWIQPEELYQIMMHEQKDSNQQLVVVDVRDEDFKEGKILNSIHHTSESILIHGFPTRFLDRFFNENHSFLVVFHCFYSQCRGPACAETFANALKSKQNVRIAVLTGGYQRWRVLYPELIEKIPSKKQQA